MEMLARWIEARRKLAEDRQYEAQTRSAAELNDWQDSDLYFAHKFAARDLSDSIDYESYTFAYVVRYCPIWEMRQVG